MTVVAKMKCHNAAPDQHNPGRAIVRLGAVWEGSTEAQTKSENAIFGEATPWAECVMGIANPNAAAYFKEGKSYRITFEEVIEEVPAA